MATRAEELLKKAKLTTKEKLELAALLQMDAEEEQRESFQKNIDEVIKLIDKLGLDKAVVAKALKGAGTVLLQWTNKAKVTYQRIEGDTVLPAWAAELKESMTMDKAMKLIPDGLSDVQHKKAERFLKAIYGIKEK